MKENKIIEIVKKDEETVHKVLASLKIKNSNDIEKDICFKDKLSKILTSFSGSWTFVLSLFGILVIWILYNTLSRHIFDPFPYILLNLGLSIICTLQSPIIMMGQNLDSKKSELRAECDYETNLKNQLYLQHLHQKIDTQDAILAKQDQVLSEQNKQIEKLVEMVSELINNK